MNNFVAEQLKVKPLGELVQELKSLIGTMTDGNEMLDILDDYDRTEKLKDKALTILHEIEYTKQIVEPITDVFFLKKLKRFEPHSDLLASFYFEFHPKDLEFIRRMIAIWTGRQLDDWQFREMIGDLASWFYMRAYPVFDQIWLTEEIISEVKKGNYSSFSRPQKFDNIIPRSE